MEMKIRRRRRALVVAFIFLIIAFLPSVLTLSHSHDDGTTADHCMICALSSAIAGMLRLILAVFVSICVSSGMLSVRHMRKISCLWPRETLFSLRVRLNP